MASDSIGKLDSHHHFWNYDPGEYAWIEPDWEVLRRDFGKQELEAVAADAGIDGAISVQARTKAEENGFLCGIARDFDLIRGVVGYVDLTGESAREALEEFAAMPKAVGVREVLQGMEDDAYCLRDDFNRGVALLHDFGLVYDILIFHRHLPNATRFVDRHPDQVFVLDHVAKPEIRTAVPDGKWVEGIRELAKRENVSCKISGMVTEVTAGEGWSPELLKPYFEVVYEAFGPRRVMFGSDWPVCLLKTGYRRWVETVESWTSGLSADERERFWSKNCAAVYLG